MQTLKSTNQISLALGIAQFRMNRLVQRIGLAMWSTIPGKARELDYQQALALALTSRCSKHAEWATDAKVLYPFMLGEVVRLGSFVDENVIILDQLKKEFNFKNRTDALAAMEETSGSFAIIEVRPACLKLAGIFGKALTEEVREIVVVK